MSSSCSYVEGQRAHHAETSAPEPWEAVLLPEASAGAIGKTVAAHPDASSAKEETPTQVLPRR